MYLYQALINKEIIPDRRFWEALIIMNRSRLPVTLKYYQTAIKNNPEMGCFYFYK
jgi:hypothetical protein